MLPRDSSISDTRRTLYLQNIFSKNSGMMITGIEFSNILQKSEVFFIFCGNFHRSSPLLNSKGLKISLSELLENVLKCTIQPSRYIVENQV